MTLEYKVSAEQALQKLKEGNEKYLSAKIRQLFEYRNKRNRINLYKIIRLQNKFHDNI